MKDREIVLRRAMLSQRKSDQVRNEPSLQKPRISECSLPSKISKRIRRVPGNRFRLPILLPGHWTPSLSLNVHYFIKTDGNHNTNSGNRAINTRTTRLAARKGRAP